MIPESNLSSGGCTLKTAERPIHTPRPDRPSRTCCLDDCTLAHCRRSRGAPKKPGPTSPG